MDPLILSLIIGGGLLFAATGRKKKRKYTESDSDTKELPPPAGSDQTLLNTLGYGVTKSAVRSFQSDFNAVQKAFDIWDRFLVVDGILGKNTRGALSRAIDYSGGSATQWKGVVKGAKDMLAQQGESTGLTGNDEGNLESLGYQIDASVTQRFQKHFNAVNTWWLTDNTEALLPITLVEDGIIGPNTREAIVAALDAQNNMQTPWGQLVAEATGQS